MNKLIPFILLLSLSLQAQTVLKTMKRLPDTGQTSDYTPTFGEDADYSINPPFYVNNGNGTTTDTVTGLVWQRTDGGEMTIENARTYVTTLNLGGFTNWRLPTAHESFSILNMDKLNPSQDIVYFPNTTAEYWWTSDVQSNDANKIWATNSGGGIGAHPKTETIGAGGTKKFHVRAVRDATTPQSVVHFKDNGDNTVTDNVTGLIWQKVPTTDTLTWEQAINYAENLVLVGKTDWRLPNIKELASINDESRTAPSVSTTFFPNVKSNRYWSSTSQKNVGANAWFNDFQNFGITSYFAKTKAYNVLCVRTGTALTSATIEADDERASIQIYPNPTASDIVINFNENNKSVLKQIQITNATGQIVFSEKSLTTLNDFHVKTDKWAAGVYFVTIFNDNRVKTATFVLRK